MKVQDIYFFLNDKFPLSSAMEYDNPGLLVGDKNATVTKVLVCLDCTLETVEQAVELGAELIVTHHPVIFSPIKNVLKGSVVYELIRNNISVISMHTNLDVLEGGVNTCLCERLELLEVQNYLSSDGFALRKAKVKPISADDFAEFIKEKLGGCVKYVDGGKMIETLLVCGGSGGEFVYDAIENGFDAVVTADIKHHMFLDAQNGAVSLFECGHFNTEDVVTEPLKNLLQAKFPDISFVSTHKSNIKYK